MVLREDPVRMWWEGMEESERRSLVEVHLPGYRLSDPRPWILGWESLNGVFQGRLRALYTRLYLKREI